MESALAVCLGIGLSAACGMRVFVPPLVMGVAVLSGHMELSEGFRWMGTYPAVTAFGVAAMLEIGAYYIPWLDNALDAMAAPAAVVAGVVVSAACVTHMSPLMRWTMAVIAGGGAAGLVQAGTSLVRAASAVATGGTGNAVVSTGEAGMSFTLSMFSILLPFLTACLVISLIGLVAIKLYKKFFGKAGADFR